MYRNISRLYGDAEIKKKTPTGYRQAEPPRVGLSEANCAENNSPHCEPPKRRRNSKRCHPPFFSVSFASNRPAVSLGAASISGKKTVRSQLRRVMVGPPGNQYVIDRQEACTIVTNLPRYPLAPHVYTVRVSPHRYFVHLDANSCNLLTRPSTGTLARNTRLSKLTPKRFIRNLE